MNQSQPNFLQTLLGTISHNQDTLQKAVPTPTSGDFFNAIQQVPQNIYHGVNNLIDLLGGANPANPNMVHANAEWGPGGDGREESTAPTPTNPITVTPDHKYVDNPPTSPIDNSALIQQIIAKYGTSNVTDPGRQNSDPNKVKMFDLNTANLQGYTPGALQYTLQSGLYPGTADFASHYRDYMINQLQTQGKLQGADPNALKQMSPESLEFMLTLPPNQNSFGPVYKYSNQPANPQDFSRRTNAAPGTPEYADAVYNSYANLHDPALAR